MYRENISLYGYVAHPRREPISLYSHSSGGGITQCPRSTDWVGKGYKLPHNKAQKCGQSQATNKCSTVKPQGPFPKPQQESNKTINHIGFTQFMFKLLLL